MHLDVDRTLPLLWMMPRVALGSAVMWSGLAAAQAAAPSAWGAAPAAVPVTAWQQCTALTEGPQRLACFDQWAQQQTVPAASVNQQPHGAAVVVTEAAAATPLSTGGCRDERYSVISRFYELEPATDCGLFSFRGYRPLSVSLTTADEINRQPNSPGKPSGAWRDYRHEELRINLSVRTKVAANLLTDASQGLQDSVWVAYSQQSHWQAFSSKLSSPFRNTDHEPEVFYVYPTDFKLPGGVRWRYSGVGLVHHSNGQSEPLSRSWNRWYVMTGADLGPRMQLHLKAWKRIRESASADDNPGIQNYWGRSEAKLAWQVNQDHTLGFAVRGTVGKGKGAGQVEWLRTIGREWTQGKSNLRLHVQLFSGYGENLIDYNVKRTSLSVGFSLLDF